MGRMRKILAGGGQPLVNYNYTDIAAGTGFVNYYAGVVSGGNLLFEKTFYSDTTSTTAIVPAINYSTIIDRDFDVFFNTPRTIKGVAIFQVPIGIQGVDSAASCNVKINVVPIIRKWNGTTETTIATGAAALWDATAAAAPTDFQYNFRTAKVTIPSTNFKKGETLRVTVQILALSARANSHNVSIGHDPMDRKSAPGDTFNMSSGSILLVNIPFKLDT